jgi:hypothetical protein
MVVLPPLQRVLEPAALFLSARPSVTPWYAPQHVFYTCGGVQVEVGEIYAGAEQNEAGFLLREVVLHYYLRAGEMDEIPAVEKRLDLLVCAKLRDRTRLERALLTQDRLREKSKAWDGVEELRRWRDSR